MKIFGEKFTRNEAAMLALLTAMLMGAKSLVYAPIPSTSTAESAKVLVAASVPGAEVGVEDRQETANSSKLTVEASEISEAEQSVSVASNNLPRNTTAPSDLPDFAAIRDVHKKKTTFFNYLLPKIRHSNDKIRDHRSLLLSIRDDLRAGTTLDSSALDTLGGLAKRYRVQANDPKVLVEALLLRVDVVPESLVLAQAANETGWGTSRFARQANNFFGVWCFTRGCGLTPLSRTPGLTHEVARYDSVQESVDAYLHTINTHNAYRELREMRAESRQEALQLTGHSLAEGLVRYSERGMDYVRDIQQLIRVNNLQRYTRPLRA